MSEFHFQTKFTCISGREEFNEPNALRFLLLPDRTKDKNPMVQIVLPPFVFEKLRDGDQYKSYRLLYSVGAVQFPDPSSGGKYFNESISHEYDLDQAGYPGVTDNDSPSLTHSLFLVSENKELSGVGEIQLRTVKGVVDRILFAINYSAKQIIRYKIDEGPFGKCRCVVIYPRIPQKVVLHICRKAKTKPTQFGMLNDVVKKQIRVGKHVSRSDKALEIVLTPDGKARNVNDKVTFHHDPGYDYRLCFASNKDANFYSLFDESIDTMETRKSRRAYLKKTKSRYKKPLSCPFCGRHIPSYAAKSKGAIYGCSGHYYGAVSDKETTWKKRIFCDNKDFQPTIGNAPLKSPLIPEGYERKGGINIVFCGKANSGKSFYQASLFNMQPIEEEGALMQSKHFRSRPYLLDTIVKNYGNLQAEEDESFGLSLNEDFTIDDTYLKARSSDKRISTGEANMTFNLRHRFNFSVGSIALGSTPSSLALTLSQNPMAYRMGDMGHVFFYDLPGEEFTGDLASKLHCILIADAFIIVIDGEKLSPFKGDAKKEDGESRNPIAQAKFTLTAFAEAIKGRATMPPVAIVITKADCLVPPIEEADADPELIGRYSNCFDYNCHNLREDIYSLLYASKTYKNSPIERHIELSHYELEEYLKSRNPDDTGDLIKYLRENFPDYKFFSCSSIGDQGVIDTSEKVGKSRTINYRPRPQRLELPLIWLLYKYGLIRR